jgi:glycosyltransferase involved in cell wall biosynthesis
VSAGQVGFAFGLGHGHYTQFLNFQECLPPAYAGRAEWIGLAHHGPFDRLPGPAGARVRLNQLWHLRRGLARHPRRGWGALVLATEQLALYPVVRSHPSYFYLDLTPSLKAELSPWYDPPGRRPAALEALRRAAFRHLYGSARGIFAMSRWAAAGIVRDWHVPPERVHVTLPGANLRRWPFVDRSGRGSVEPVRILMVGAQFRMKGGELLLRWAEQTRATNWVLDVVTWPNELPPWVTALLGNPPPGARISATLAPRLPRVRVHCGLNANEADLLALYRDADVFCLPTQADGSSIASLEAMASGLPVIVGAVGGIPELIRQGDTGFLVARGDQGDLAARLDALLDDPALRLRVGRAARESCEDVYNVERQMRQIFAVLSGFASSPPAPRPVHWTGAPRLRGEGGRTLGEGGALYVDGAVGGEADEVEGVRQVRGAGVVGFHTLVADADGAVPVAQRNVVRLGGG